MEPIPGVGPEHIRYGSPDRENPRRCPGEGDAPGTAEGAARPLAPRTLRGPGSPRPRSSEHQHHRSLEHQQVTAALTAVLGVVLLVAVEIRCLLRINRQLGAPSDEPRYFDDVGSDLDRYR